MGGLSRRELQVIAGIFAATVLAGVAHYADWAALLAFAIATVALAGLAHLVSLATEQVGERFGPAATGVLQSTLGNLPELFVVIFALRAGEVVVAQTSIIGSLFANALLVLGLVIVFGARQAPRRRDALRAAAAQRHRDAAAGRELHHRHRRGGARDARARRPARARDLHRRGHRAAGGLPGMGGALRARRVRVRAEARVGPARGVRASRSGCWPPAALGAAFVSDWFVAALRPTIDQLGVSEAFAGLVVVAIAGNAVENVAGLVLARKGQADLAISVVKNSVAQVAAFLYPALVLISLLFAHQLTFALAPVLIAALLLTALAMWQITGDGEAAEFEGWALVAIYVILAVFTLYE